MPPHKGCAVSLRQWLQNLPHSSQRNRSHEEPTNPTRTLTLNATTTPHELKLIKSIPALTPREVEIVRLLRKGYSNKEIAQELGIAVTTVKWNMTNILGKFEVQSSRQLLALLATLPPDDSREWTIME
jgi:DNA-binding NarL/FixJ family response regulator